MFICSIRIQYTGNKKMFSIKTGHTVHLIFYKQLF